MWNFVPKHKFHGYKSIKAANSLSTRYFNDGASAFATTMAMMDTPPNNHTIRALQDMDEQRIAVANNRATEAAKAR